MTMLRRRCCARPHGGDGPSLCAAGHWQAAQIAKLRRACDSRPSPHWVVTGARLLLESLDDLLPHARSAAGLVRLELPCAGFVVALCLVCAFAGLRGVD